MLLEIVAIAHQKATVHQQNMMYKNYVFFYNSMKYLYYCDTKRLRPTTHKFFHKQINNWIVLEYDIEGVWMYNTFLPLFVGLY